MQGSHHVRCMQCTLMLRFPSPNCNFNSLVHWEGEHDVLSLALWVRKTPRYKKGLICLTQAWTAWDAHKRQVKLTCGVKRQQPSRRLHPSNPSDSKESQTTPQPHVDVYVLDAEGTGDCALRAWSLPLSNASGRLLCSGNLRIGPATAYLMSSFYGSAA